MPHGASFLIGSWGCDHKRQPAVAATKTRKSREDSFTGSSAFQSAGANCRCSLCCRSHVVIYGFTIIESQNTTMSRKIKRGCCLLIYEVGTIASKSEIVAESVKESSWSTWHVVRADGSFGHVKPLRMMAGGTTIIIQFRQSVITCYNPLLLYNWATHLSPQPRCPSQHHRWNL